MNFSARFRNSPIRHKLTQIGYLTFVVVLFIVGTLLIANEVLQWRGREISALESFAAIIGANAAPAVVFNDSAAANDTLSALAAQPDIDIAAIYSSNGKLFAMFRTPGSSAVPPEQAPRVDGHNFTLQRITLCRSIIFKGEKIGMIHLQSTLNEMYSELATDLGLILLATLTAFAMGTMLFGRLLKTIVEPIHDLATTMTAVSNDSNYSLRAEVASGDEIGVLSQSFNSMLETVQARDTELAQHRDRLEQDVAFRTSELQKANARLEQELTERERIQASLQESEERFRLSFEFAAIGIAITSLSGHWLKVNPALCHMLGYSEAEMLAMDFQSITHPDDLAGDMAAMKQLLAGEIHPYQAEKRYVHKDGRAVWIRLNVAMTRDAAGTPLNFACQIEDITERKQAEASLEQRTNELRFINDVVEQASQAFCAVDAQGRIIRSNRALEQMNGYSAEELANMQVRQLSSGRWPDRDLKKISEVLQTGQPVRYENEYRRKDGGLFVAEVAGGAYRNKKGEIESAYAFITDLTERKQSEEALRESEERFRSAFESSAIGMAIVSLEGRWLEVNHSLCQMIGYSEGELLRTDFQSITHPDDLQPDLEQVRRLIAGEIAHYSLEKRYFHKLGHTVWVLLSVSLVHARDGSADHFIAQVENITQRKLAAEALDARSRDLEQSNLELERSNRELEQFAFATAHDLQTPLRGIVGFAQLLQRNAGSRLSAEAVEYMNRIVDGTHSMQRLVQSLLEYSRVSNHPNRHWADLNYLLDEAKEELKQIIEERHAVIESAVLPTLNIDARQIAQLLRSLVSNAIKFQPGEAPQVRISARQDGPEWIISVSDSGIGIPPEHQKRIFQIFQRLHTADQYEGAGVGLALCEKIVHNHGGRLWVESTPGGGSTFYFSIPNTTGVG